MTVQQLRKSLEIFEKYDPDFQIQTDYNDISICYREYAPLISPWDEHTLTDIGWKMDHSFDNTIIWRIYPDGI